MHTCPFALRVVDIKTENFLVADDFIVILPAIYFFSSFDGIRARKVPTA